MGGSGGDASRKRSADPRGHRIPEDWQPSAEDREWFREHCPDLAGQGAALTEEFRDYWLAKAGKDARKVDWSRTWRNRMRERQDRAANQRHPPTRSRSTTDDRVAAVEALRARPQGPTRIASERADAPLAPPGRS